MLSVTKPSDNRINLDLKGEIDADDMRKGLDDLLSMSADMTGGRMFYTITEFAIPTFGALMVEMGRIPQMFSLLGRFDKCAVLTDAGWLRSAAEIEGKLFPGIEIKGFALDETEAAEAWLAA